MQRPEVKIGAPKKESSTARYQLSTEDAVFLPYLRNADQVDDAFMQYGMCIVYPSVDFFSNRPNDVAQQRAVCAECTVTDDCLYFSVVTAQYYGTWGGKTEAERLPLIKMLLEKESA